jgi:hypothetical protein
MTLGHAPSLFQDVSVGWEIWTELDAAARAVREEPDALAALNIIGEAMDRLIGSRMLTFLRFDLERFDMERLYCTVPGRYPMGARKPMRRGPWFERVVEQGEVFIASGADAIRATFTDHEALAELGCASTMCVPVRHLGRTLGTMNLNGEEGHYGDRQAALAQPFATLAVPAFLTIGR